MSVMLGWLHGSHVAAQFTSSLLHLVVHDAQTAGHLRRVESRYSHVNVSEQRNQLVRTFLDGDEDWCWLVDSDMQFPPDLLEVLLATAHPEPEHEHYSPIVGGLCFGIDDKMQLFPTVYQWDDTVETGLTRAGSVPENTMVAVGATGAACLLVHRHVLERMGTEYAGTGAPWFQETWPEGRHTSEDLTFCWRARQLGFPIYVNTAAKTGHLKMYVLTDEMYRQQRRSSPWTSLK